MRAAGWKQARRADRLNRRHRRNWCTGRRRLEAFQSEAWSYPGRLEASWCQEGPEALREGSQEE